MNPLKILPFLTRKRAFLHRRLSGLARANEKGIIKFRERKAAKYSEKETKERGGTKNGGRKEKRRGKLGKDIRNAQPEKREIGPRKKSFFFFLPLFFCVSPLLGDGGREREKEEGSFLFFVQDIQRLLKGKNISCPAYTGNQTMIAFSI